MNRNSHPTGFGHFDIQVAIHFRTMLIDSVFPDAPAPSHLDELISESMIHNHLERPGDYRLELVVFSVAL